MKWIPSCHPASRLNMRGMFCRSESVVVERQEKGNCGRVVVVFCNPHRGSARGYTIPSRGGTALVGGSSRTSGEIVDHTQVKQPIGRQTPERHTNRMRVDPF